MNPWLRYAVVLAFAASDAVAVDVRYEVALRSDVLARTHLTGDLGQSVTGDLQLAPRAQVSLGVDASTFHFLYAPTILWREPVQGPRLEGDSVIALHHARLAFDTRWQRGVFTIAEDASFGRTYVGALRNPEGATEPVAEVQSAGMVGYLRSFTSMGVESRPTDRLTLGVSAGYQVSGSPDGDARSEALLPLQYGPFGLATARATVSRIDGLATSAQFNQARFSTGVDQLVAQLRETWDRQLSRTTTFTLGAGLALAREEVTQVTPATPFVGTYLDLLPVAETGLAWRDVLAGRPLRLDASLRMAPFADRFTGNVYERVELRGHGEWRFAKDWLATAAAGGAIAVPVSLAIARPPDAPGNAQAGDRVIYGEATVVWTVKTWLLLQATARVLWTEQPRTGMPGQVQAAGTISVTVLQQDSLAF